MAFVENHYLIIHPGANWELVLDDFYPGAEIINLRLQADLPAMEVQAVGDFFSSMSPAIDSMREFEIRPLGLRAQVYDHIANVWAHVHVRSVDDAGEEYEFYAVDQFSLALDGDGQWRITHLLYQRTVDGWPAPSDFRMGSFIEGSALHGSSYSGISLGFGITNG